MSEFEQQLSQRPIRPAPNEWRRQILSAARSSQEVPSRVHPRYSAWWHEWLWPCPQAWAALAVVWIGILALHFNTASSAGREKEAISPTNRIVAFAEQRKLLSQVLDPLPDIIAEAPRNNVPRPRSEKRNEFQMG
jgi:hypothetical protein